MGGFFFKQKTAYEMRISDWSSDVCSSDLQQQDLPDHFGNHLHTDILAQALVLAEAEVEVVIENAVRVEAVRVLVGIGVEHRRLGQQTSDRHRGNNTFVGCSLGVGVVAGRFAENIRPDGYAGKSLPNPGVERGGIAL